MQLYMILNVRMSHWTISPPFLKFIAVSNQIILKVQKHQSHKRLCFRQSYIPCSLRLVQALAALLACLIYVIASSRIVCILGLKIELLIPFKACEGFSVHLS